MSGAISNIMTNGVGQCFKDPTSEITASLGSLASHPALGGHDAGLASMASQVSSHMSSQLAALPTRLPMLAAVETMQKSVATFDGQLPGKDGGPTLNTAFSGLTGVQPLVGGLHAQIQSLLDAAPPPTAPVAGQPVTVPPVVAQVQALIAGASASLTSLATASAAALNQGMGQLHSFAFASFMSMPQSPALKEVMDKFVSIPPTLKAEKDIMSASSSALQGTVVQASPVLPKNETIAPPIISEQPKPMPAAQKTALQGDIAAKKAIFDAALVEFKAAAVQCQEWQAANNYKAVKQAWRDSTGQAEADAWHALKDRYEAEAYNNYQDKYVTWSLAKDDYDKALASYSSGLNG